jgi:hypothetical protein
MAHSTKTSAIPPAERIGKSYKKLASITPGLHSAAEELSKTIDALNESLYILSLDVSAWHAIAQNEDENGHYWSRSIGYTKLKHQWGIALREASGHKDDNIHNEQVWAFSKAPPWMVIESIAKLPDLFETLIERVNDTTEKLKARTKQANELVAAVNAVVDQIAQGTL